MPRTGARANELRSKPIKTQTLRPEAGLLQMHPVDTTPLCPERVPERMNYVTNPKKAHTFGQRAGLLQPTYPCRSSPCERKNSKSVPEPSNF